MADKTGIEWTDATWNPTTGCVKVSSGCKHCYAERDWARLVHLPAYAGRSFTDVACHPDRLSQPLRWQKPRMIFVNSMSDLFHESIPDEFIERVLTTTIHAQQHIFQILTKRPERMRDVMQRWTDMNGRAQRNLWLGVSVENQEAADERIPLLIKTPAAVRWISAEPLLGAIDLTNCEHPNYSIRADYLRGIDSRTGVDSGTVDWVVVGGESGVKARPMHPRWARDLRDQCAAAGVPFLFKQHGEWIHDDDIDNCGLRSPEIADAGQYFNTFDWPHENTESYRVGKKAAGRLLDGVQHDGYPQVSA